MAHKELFNWRSIWRQFNTDTDGDLPDWEEQQEAIMRIVEQEASRVLGDTMPCPQCDGSGRVRRES